MVQLRGGPELVGLTGLLERMYYRFLMALDMKDTEVDVMCTKESGSAQGKEHAHQD